jgi:anti-sigma regulatory factor (Ser/Thr protein kinase)
LAKVQARKEGASNVGERTEQAITLSLPSSMRHVNLLEVIVTEILKEADFTEDIQEQINLAVIEAGTNATKHNNKEDPEKQTTFQLILAENQFTIATEDEGEEQISQRTSKSRLTLLSLKRVQTRLNTTTKRIRKNKRLFS